MIPQEVAAGLLFAAAGGRSGGLLDARRQNRNGTLGYDTFDVRDSTLCGVWRQPWTATLGRCRLSIGRTSPERSTVPEPPWLPCRST